jgi:hypothetical protein
MVRGDSRNTYSFRKGSEAGVVILPQADFVPGTQLKTGRVVMGCVEQHIEHSGMSALAACKAVAGELIKDWVKKGVAPKSVNAVTDQLMCSHKEMKRLQDYTSSTSLKKPKDLDKRTSSFNIAIRKGHDIHSEHKSRVVSIEKEMGRKMTESDFEFYKDNCLGDRQIHYAPRKTQKS